MWQGPLDSRKFSRSTLEAKGVVALQMFIIVNTHQMYSENTCILACK